MNGSVCIHGHFYQPPRQDPWLEDVLPEASAAPFLNWNERISRECYYPLAFARVLDGQGYIREIINCYEWINFNFGPTLLSWMEHHLPRTYARILDADRISRERTGYGNAMAQVYHHTILPLDSPRERAVEIRWSIYDFKARFGRRPEGMWLAETAVDTPTLEDLAAEGIKYTILSPAQAEAVSPLEQDQWESVSGSGLDAGQPYKILLPSGKSISVFFFHAGLANSVAFDRVLADGEGFWQKLVLESGEGMALVATDGESYGHHFKFGEMALAYVIDQAAKNREGLTLKNAGQLLDEFPPKRKVKIREDSSWSCPHGLKRWQEHCGCADGGHPGWKQHWRKPLRRALNYLKYYADEHFAHAARQVISDPQKAFLEYGRVLSGLQDRDEFVSSWFVSGTENGNTRAWSLLEMQRHCLAAFASCAWFFDDLYRLEPMNALTSARRGLQLLEETGGPDIREGFLQLMEDAESNRSEAGNGRTIWTTEIEPRLIDSRKLALTAFVAQSAGGQKEFPGAEISVHPGNDACSQEAEIVWKRTGVRERITAEFAGGGLDECGLLGDAKEMRFSYLPPRLKSLVSCWLASDLSQKQWVELVQRARELAGSGLYTEPGQKELVRAMHGLAPGLVWSRIQGEPVPDRVFELARQVVSNNPLLAETVQERAGEHILQMFSAGEKDEIVARVISRCKEAGIAPDMFEIQNLVWQERDRRDRELLIEAGIALPAGVK
jgi:hypothetical protein